MAKQYHVPLFYTARGSASASPLGNNSHRQRDSNNLQPFASSSFYSSHPRYALARRLCLVKPATAVQDKRPNTTLAMAGLPEALRVGTPVLERGDSPYHEYPNTNRRTSTHQSNSLDPCPTHRASHASLVSIGSIRTTRPPHSIVETDDHDCSYRPERLPPLPTLPITASPSCYGSASNPFSSPFDSPFDPHGAQYAKPARKPSLLSKLGSISSRRSASRYGVLVDEEEIGFRNARHKRLSSPDEHDSDRIGIDLSSFESPLTVHGFEPHHRDIRQGAEKSHVLEVGMNTVRSASIAVPGQCNHIQGVSAIEAQRKTARILAVTEVSEYDYKLDISSVSGGAPTRNNTSETFVNREGGPKKSYYFPVDPEQPAWRPIVMRRPWITLLVFIALALSGLQEFLCRLSMRRAKGTPPKGILTFERAAKLTLWQYFAWKYMPTVVLLSYGIMWQAVDYEVKRLEPYYQLSKRVGATARDSLNQDYLTFTAYLVPFKAVRAKQWAVVYSSMATLFAGSLVPVLQSASICMLPDKKDRQVGHDKYVRMDPIWSRVLSGALLCVALFGVLLLNQLRRKSGLLSDPKGIAGIASMATKSHILNDFEGLDVAPNNVIHNQLRTRRYNLHKSSLWQGQYIKSEEKVQNVKEEHPHPCLLRLQAGIPFVTYILLVGASIPCFVFIEDAKFVSERVPFLLTALATGIKLGWGELDMNLRVIEPYYVLSRRNAPPRTLVMDYTGTVPGYYSLLAWRDGHYLLASVGFGSILTEILTVCVTSFSVDGRRFIAGNGGDDKSDGETFRSFWVSFALAMGIILYLVIMAYLVYKLRRHRFLPRQPGTIAGVLAFIHQSNMLDDFNDTERMDSRQMRQHLEKLGKTYALGWFNGRDGEDHCGVDQEPLVAPYKFGVDWKKGRVNNFGQDWSTY